LTASYVIRPLASGTDFAACVALQHQTWGADFSDVVAPSILQVSQRVGGVAAGAFDGDGAMLGFVFGLTGVRNGEIVHWSDMLAVRPDARNRGVGSRLKAFQRNAVRAIGGTTIYWTFDPLVARNAYLNFNKLGASTAEYVPDMYGTTDSPLHGGVPTDRLIVAWSTNDDVAAARASRVRDLLAEPGWDSAPVLNDVGDGSPAAVRFLPRVRIRVPGDAEQVLTSDAPRAAQLRLQTRRAFTSALAAGYAIVGVRRGADARDAHYCLARGGMA
jgi:predicted GNAT superfamily acetyltransferase